MSDIFFHTLLEYRKKHPTFIFYNLIVPLLPEIDANNSDYR